MAKSGHVAWQCQVVAVTQHPRMMRVAPVGEIQRPKVGIPVLATIRWHRAQPTQMGAMAVAWTREAVEIDWITPWGSRRTDWIPAPDVKRIPPCDSPSG